MKSLTRLAAVGAAALLTLALGSVAPAAAAPGDPFDPARPTIFIAQGDPTQLSIAEPDADGNFSFVDEGSPAGALRYNGVSYSTADNYLYGFTDVGNGTIPAGALVRIGEGGVVTRVGTTTFPSAPGINAAAYNPADGLIYATAVPNNLLYKVNPTTGVLVDTITLSQSLQDASNASDLALSQGFLWGLGADRTMVRVNPTTGQVDEFDAPAAVDPGVAGAAWTYIDGTLGFSTNSTGQINRIAISDPSSATPTFTLLQQRTGPASGNNDAAASPGLPADLAVTKTSAGFAPGARVTYTITVTNNGAGFSTGWLLTDDVAAGLTAVQVSSADADCVVAGNSVECIGGELAPSASATITVSAAVPASQTGEVANSATVVGNEPDPNPANNTGSVVDRVVPATPAAPAAPGAPLTGAESASSTLPLGLLAGGLLLTAMAAGGALQARRRS